MCSSPIQLQSVRMPGLCADTYLTFAASEPVHCMIFQGTSADVYVQNVARSGTYVSAFTFTSACLSAQEL